MEKNKKMTKAQEKEMLLIKEEKKRKREKLIRDVENFWKDAEAVKRVARLNKDETKTNYHGELIEEEKEKLLNNYESLKFLSNIDYKENKSWSVVRILVDSNKTRRNYYNQSESFKRAKEYLKEDSVWIDDIIWSHKEMQLYVSMLQEYGIDYIYYTNSSTGALGNLTSLVSMGATISGTTSIREDGEGLIIDIRNANADL